MILEIDTGAGFVPVACLTSFNETESAATIGTTTRDTGGWRDGVVTTQKKQITGAGIIPVDVAFFSYEDMVSLKRSRTEFTWRVENDQGQGIISAIDLGVSQGEDVSFTFTIECIGQPVNTDLPPFGYRAEIVTKPVTSANVDNFACRIRQGEVGADYTYTISSSEGGTPIVLTGVVTSTAMNFSGIDLSGLQDGIIAARLVLTNANGDGPEVSDLTVKNLDL